MSILKINLSPMIKSPGSGRMVMRALLIPLIAWSLSIPAHATPPFSFGIEDPALQPVPNDVAVTLAAFDSNIPEMATCTYIGQSLPLSASTNKLEYVVATTQAPCGCGAYLCPIYVLRKSQGAYEVILNWSGYGLSIKKGIHHGLNSLEILAGSAGHSENTVWRFNGKKYEKLITGR
ncbi:hypothetical protein [Methylomonas sp. MK1]|uniref:hypothetical protein n=1 Tax=Methylomonas sp. MK1 TaxID=1131552 RepID=UPI0012678BC4|nr:hypothetical protein [Methylomonas sp. MK1]